MSSSFLTKQGASLLNGDGFSWETAAKDLAVSALGSGAGMFADGLLDGSFLGEATGNFSGSMMETAGDQMLTDGKIDMSWGVVAEHGISAVTKAGADSLTRRDYGLNPLGNKMTQSFASSFISNTGNNLLLGKSAFSQDALWQTAKYSAGNSLVTVGDYFKEYEFGYGKTGDAALQSFSSSFLSTAGNDISNDQLTWNSTLGTLQTSAIKGSADGLGAWAAGKIENVEAKLNGKKNEVISKGEKLLEKGEKEFSKKTQFLSGLSKEIMNSVGEYTAYLTGEKQRLVKELEDQGLSKEQIDAQLAMQEAGMYESDIKYLIKWGVDGTQTLIKNKVKSAVGAKYNEETGKYDFTDSSKDERNLFYSNNLEHATDFASDIASFGLDIGGIILDKKLTGSGGDSSVSLLTQKDLSNLVDKAASTFDLDIDSHEDPNKPLTLWEKLNGVEHGPKGKATNLWTKIADTLKKGEDTKSLLTVAFKDGKFQLSQDPAKYNLSLGEAVQLKDDYKAVKFQLENLKKGEVGKAAITYVNTGVLSGDSNAMKTSIEIFEGEKDLVFGTDKIDGINHLGHADWDGKTIHLNKEALNYKDNNVLGKYSAIMAKEGFIQDWNKALGNTELTEKQLLENGGETAVAVLADRYMREMASYQVTESVMEKMEQNLGIKVEDEKFKKSVELAAQGKFSEAGVRWSTGQDAKKINILTGYPIPENHIPIGEIITKPVELISKYILGPVAKAGTEKVLAPVCEKVIAENLGSMLQELAQNAGDTAEKTLSPLKDKIKNVSDMKINWTPPKYFGPAKMPLDIMTGSWNFAVNLAEVAEKQGKGELSKKQAFKEYGLLMGKRTWGHFEVAADNAGLKIKMGKEDVDLKDIKDRIKKEFEYTKKQIEIMDKYNSKKITKDKAREELKKLMKDRFVDYANEGMKVKSNKYKKINEKYEEYKKKYKKYKELAEDIDKGLSKKDSNYKAKKEEYIEKYKDYKKKYDGLKKDADEKLEEIDIYKKMKGAKSTTDKAIDVMIDKIFL